MCFDAKIANETKKGKTICLESPPKNANLHRYLQDTKHMKKLFYFLLAALMVCGTVSCKKDGGSSVKIITVKSGADLQAAIDQAEGLVEIRVEADAVFAGSITLRDNIRLSGGWTNEFKERSLFHRSVIDGKDVAPCIKSLSEGKNITVSGFELRNGYGGGIVFSGPLTVEYCWIHHCFSEDQGGAVANMEKSGDELLLANSIIEYNRADAHGGAIAVRGQGTKMVVVNCLIRGNASIAQYGYTGAIHGQAGVQAYLVNNTIVDNINWRDGSSATSTPWSVLMFRNSGTHIEMVNNIVAGNWYFKPGVANNSDAYPDRYDMPIKPKYRLEMQVYSIDLNIIGNDDPDWICRSNLLGSLDGRQAICRAGTDSAREEAQAACTIVANSEFDTIFQNAALGDYHPAGPALETGENSELVRSILGAYQTDLAGNPRIKGGKITAGCYQP